MMHTIFSRHFLLCLTSCFLAANSIGSPCHAEEKEVGTRELSQEAIERAEELEATAALEEPHFWNEEGELSLNNWQPTWNNPSTTIQYHVAGFDTTHNLVCLTDGSEWKISPYDINSMGYWEANQRVAIEVDNKSWVSAKNAGEPYFYHLHNFSNNQSVRVLLYKGSSINSPLYRDLIALSIGAHQLSLNDSSTWIVSSQDLPLFEEWSVNDTIIVGSIRKGWFNFYNHFESILINVDANHYVRAKQI